ncbi:MAG: sugar ABC transporter ATP-binding protein [Rhodospirillum sp.]|nr:sugar ABC transporter ATP-binding protein [Rhodospirillum sp.]MCF8491768.1 sugar ABC transporter ATP-binding protein [Rhodospirillum sp.]MCF8501624.1 sugar ABC transporter ATP-binding protein [Rhodospirillum sp.]
MEAIERPQCVHATGLRKSYGATIALGGVDLDVGAGEVHALLGENGAGKSTLVKILSGIVRPDEGAMTLFGEAYSPQSIRDARRTGVATAFQELSLVPNLSVAQNLLLPRGVKNALGLNSRKRTIEAGAAILEAHGLGRIDPAARIADLPLADKQRIEITRAVNQNPKVLILDEPTASLAEVDWVFDLIRSASDRGTAVLHISHRLDEVRALCERATVLRNGLSVATVDLKGADNAAIFEMMVGHAAQGTSRRGASRSVGDVRLAVEGLSSARLSNVSFSLREGEILGVAALEGQGQSELFRVLAGAEQPTKGRILLNGQPRRFKDTGDALNQGGGVAFVPEERKTDGILPGMSARAHITLSVLDRLAKFLVLTSRAETETAHAAGTAVDFADRYQKFPINALSGGNQQKAILARALATGARTLVLLDPTRGVDVGTKETIYGAIRRFAETGGSVVLYSSELAELVQLSDRCLILYGGAVFDELEGDEIQEHVLVAGVTGHRHEHHPRQSYKEEATA